MGPQRTVFLSLEASYEGFQVLFHKRSLAWHRGTPHHIFYEGVLLGCLALIAIFPSAITFIRIKSRILQMVNANGLPTNSENRKSGTIL
jgi:hypothetical protein